MTSREMLRNPKRGFLCKLLFKLIKKLKIVANADGCVLLSSDFNLISNFKM